MKAKQAFKLFAMFSCFMLAGPTLIMNNKTILRDKEFNFPLTLASFTLMFNSLSGFILVYGFGFELKNKAVITQEFYMRKVLPIGFLTAGTIVLGMASYLFLTVSFVQMLKAFTPVMTLFFLFMFKLSTPKTTQFYCVIVICIGTAIAGSGELNFNLTGALCMLSAQVCEALKLVFTQKVLKSDKVEGNKIKFSIFESLFYISPASTLFVFLFAFVLEFPYFGEVEFKKMFENFHLFLFSGIVAILTNLINWVVIQKTDALMLKLMATARNALLLLFNAFFLSDQVTNIQFIGYFLSILGFMGYNYFKLNDSKSPPISSTRTNSFTKC